MTYLLAVNLDIKYEEDKSSSERFLSAVRAVASLANGKNKVVIVSHRGRPQAREENLSLREFSPLFERKLKKKILFLDNAALKKAKEKITEAQSGSIFLLENTRFLKGETENSLMLAKELASLGDAFVNDDFPTAHRRDASNVGITKYLPSKMGPNFKKEVYLLSRAIDKPMKPFILIIGGAKMADKLGVIKNLLPKTDRILLGGGAANTFLKARGIDIGGSLYEEDMLAKAKILAKNPKMVLPIDYRKDGNKILDIGPKTVRLYRRMIGEAKTIIWGGPMGYYEDKRFANGSREIAKAIASSKAYSIVGGGDTDAVVRELKIGNKIDLVSTGGGAMLDFLAGKKMPALDALWRKS